MMDWIPDDEYRNFQYLMPICCVDVVVRQGDFFLLIRRLCEPALGQWWLPGGRVRKGEFTQPAAERIVQDEVGLECDFDASLGVYETQFTTGPYGIPVHTINVCYRFRARPGQLVRLDANHSEFRWVPFGHVPDDLHLDPRLLPILRHP